MVTALPRNIRLKLAQTLAQWRHWQCDPPLSAAPVPRQLLSDGLSNFNVLVEAGQQFVVRIDGINPRAHGLSRQLEWRALQSAHSAGLAPRPRYFNPELGCLVCDYLPPDAQQALDIQDLATLLRGIHRLPARHHRLDLGERLLRYEKLLEHRAGKNAAAVAPYRHRLHELLAVIEDDKQANVLCHNDLLRANRIYSEGRLWAIDWEYCAMGNPRYDIAVVATGDRLTPEQLLELLEAYLERTASDRELHQLLRYGCVYRYLELLWYLALEHPDLDDELLQGKLAEFSAALLQLGD